VKYLLVFVVLAIAFVWWNAKRKASRRSEPVRDASARAPSADAKGTAPQDMVCCPVCSLHLPRGDAVEGRLGLYCSHEHRQRAE
jgi:uncharacterized protein